MLNTTFSSLPLWSEILFVFLSQLTMIFLRFVNVRAIANHNIGLSMFLTAGIQISWLIASSLGIKALLSGNMLVVASYVAGGVIGSWLSFLIKVEKRQ